MLSHTAYIIALIASLIWFLMGFRFFSFQQDTSAKVMIPKSSRSSPLFLTLAAATRFLGGFNGAWALLCAVLLGLAFVDSPLFSQSGERGLLLFVLAGAHFSQFIFNVPVLLNGERQGEAYWPVLSGPMLMIFVVDAVQTVICLSVGAIQFMA